MMRFMGFPQVKGLVELQTEIGCLECKHCSLVLMGSADCCLHEDGYAPPRFQSPGNIQCSRLSPRALPLGRIVVIASPHAE